MTDSTPSSRREHPHLLVVGCGHIGEHIVRTYIDRVPHDEACVYVTDSDKDRARKVSEYRVSAITPIRWRSAHDTPDDVDVIVIAVGHENEHKIIDRLALSKKPFVTLSDDASIFDAYEEYEDEWKSAGVTGVMGTGLLPGAANVLARYATQEFDRVYDIACDRIGFVSPSSLASIKSARRDAPLSVRDGIITDSRRKAGNVLSWFPSPYNMTPCQSVATGVRGLQRSYPGVHHLTVRYAEPKLPTFSERVKNVFFSTPVSTTRACLRVEVHGTINNEISTRIYAMMGNAMSIITETTLATINGVHNTKPSESPLVACDDVVTPRELLPRLHDVGIVVTSFEGA